jgi:cytochrome c nitrite reductase small subunit
MGERPGTAPWALLILTVGLGVMGGLGAYTFRYAEGLSYLKTDPKACANCHIMQSQYDGWQKASHHTAAVCVDCHLPHDFVGKYLTKAENGWRHGKLFTLQTFHEPIEIAPRGREILEENCRRCHAELHESTLDASPNGAELACTHCHSSVGHGIRSALGGPLRPEELHGSDPTTN